MEYGRKHTDGSRSGGQKPVKKIENHDTREMIREFSHAFDRPVNYAPATPSVTDRLLLGKLLLEETLEYIEKGLGLTLTLDEEGYGIIDASKRLGLRHDEGQRYDPVEAADGLGDVNVIIHFNALWEGIDLDAVTTEIHRSNMSKLGENGKPIINKCLRIGCESTCDCGMALLPDTNRPAGKILKGPNYSPPNLLPILGIIPHEEEE